MATRTLQRFGRAGRYGKNLRRGPLGAVASVRHAVGGYVPADMPIIKTKWSAVETVGNLCNTMKNVAAGKLPSCERQLRKARPFASAVLPFFEVDSLPDDSAIKIDAHIAIGTERGMCGQTNSVIARNIGKDLKVSREKDRKQLVFGYGKKGAGKVSAQCKKGANAEMTEGYGSIKNKNPNFALSCDSLDRLLKHDFDRIAIHYNQYKNSQVFVPLKKTMYSEEISKQIANMQFPSYDIEGDDAMLIGNLMQFKMASTLYLALCENQASENGARLKSMDGAVQACQEKAVEYEKIFQGLRKDKITNELTVLSCGVKSIQLAAEANAV